MAAPQQFGLALAFLKSEPAAAAQLLERQPPVEVAAFLSNVPYDHTTGVFNRMLPNYAAGICQHMAPEIAAAVLAALSNTTLATVLRQLPFEKQRQLNALFPEKIQLTLRIVFNYSDDAVGAWMMPNGLSLPLDCLVSDALERIAQHGANGEPDQIPIVDRDGLLQGEVSLRALLSASPAVAISSLTQPADQRLLGRANLETESNHPGWHTRDTLPVVDRAAKLIGVLRHVDLRRGLTHGERPAERSSDQGIISQMAQAYTACIVALANTFFESEKR